METLLFSIYHIIVKTKESRNLFKNMSRFPLDVLTKKINIESSFNILTY